MADSESKKTIFLISNTDFSKAQGSTEPYYVSRFLAERSDLHIFTTFDNSIDDSECHCLPMNGAASIILLNTLLIPYWIYQLYSEDPEVIYCYENIIIPPLLGQVIAGAKVAFDLRSDPYHQGKELSSKFRDRSRLFRILLHVSRIGHSFALRKSDYIFALSEPLAKSIADTYGVDSNKIRLLPLGVETNRFEPQIDSFERISVVYVGTLTRRRGIDTLIEAVHGLPTDLQNRVRVDLYGDGPTDYISNLVSKAAETPLIVEWHGKVPHEELPERAGRSDIAVSPLPPHEAYEVSSPAKLFEYLALGLPVIASRITPHERILKEGQNALLYEPTSAESLRLQLETLIMDEEMRSEYAECARWSAMNYRWENRFSVLEPIFS